LKKVTLNFFKKIVWALVLSFWALGQAIHYIPDEKSGDAVPILSAEF
jgi:hypothetical protein